MVQEISFYKDHLKLLLEIIQVISVWGLCIAAFMLLRSFYTPPLDDFITPFRIQCFRIYRIIMVIVTIATIYLIVKRLETF